MPATLADYWRSWDPRTSARNRASPAVDSLPLHGRELSRRLCGLLDGVAIPRMCSSPATWLEWHRATAKNCSPFNHCRNTLVFVYTVTMPQRISGSGRACGVAMKRPVYLIAVDRAGCLRPGGVGVPGGGASHHRGKAAGGRGPCGDAEGTRSGEGPQLEDPRAQHRPGHGDRGADSRVRQGRRVAQARFRVGAALRGNRVQGLAEEKTEPGDVQIRGTIKHRF